MRLISSLFVGLLGLGLVNAAAPQHHYEQLQHTFKTLSGKFSQLDGNNNNNNNNNNGVKSACLTAIQNINAQLQACGVNFNPAMNATATTAPTSATPATANPLGPLNNFQKQLIAQATQITATLCPKAACLQNVLAAVNTAGKVCWGRLNNEVADQIATFQQVNTFLQVGCSTDGNGNFCLPQFLTAGFELTNQVNFLNDDRFNPLANYGKGKMINTTLLNGVCTTCAQQVSNAIITLNTNAGGNTFAPLAAALNIACIKDPNTPGQFCVNTLANPPPTAAPTTAATTAPAAANTTAAAATTAAPAAPFSPNAAAFTPFQASINQNLCTPCYRLVFNAVEQASFFSTTIAGQIATNANNNALDALCAINPVTNQRCAATALEFQNQFGPIIAQCITSFALKQTCTTQCSAALNKLVTAEGCCFSTFLKAFQASLPNFDIINGNTFTTKANTPQTAINLFLNNCNVTVPAVCPTATAPKQISVVVVNLNFTFFQANQAAVTATIQQDVAAAAGVAPSSVIIDSVKPAGNGGARVVVVVSAPAQADVNTATAAISNQLSNGGVSMVATASLAANDQTALIQPNQALVATTDPNGGTQNSASSLSFSFSALIAVAIASLALKQ